VTPGLPALLRWASELLDAQLGALIGRADAAQPLRELQVINPSQWLSVAQPDIATVTITLHVFFYNQWLGDASALAIAALRGHVYHVCGVRGVVDLC